ncbi:hypothetical protein GCK72_022109 [Caenorhabditis remanei]|uniref:Uncharacterized protein n=1 Tax=Caenorhabditis remanei TaxID=31234 RepID=A0A6A5FSY2_CAERE|nr:hypothetical protein GCK72_022109 [Caenorhabditis remanei]KAF1745662.1 hypothetical protein GCK72_022109 [Caenorhabditis remanei]
MTPYLSGNFEGYTTRKQRNATTEWDVEEDFIHPPEIERRAPTRKIRLGESKEQQVKVSVPAKPSMQPGLEDFKTGILLFKTSGDNYGSGDIHKKVTKVLQPSKF